MKKQSSDRRAKINAAKSRNEAIQYIRSAITVLCDSAQNGDELAKESIANLGVVLFDLQ